MKHHLLGIRGRFNRPQEPGRLKGPGKLKEPRRLSRLRNSRVPLPSEGSESSKYFVGRRASGGLACKLHWELQGIDLWVVTHSGLSFSVFQLPGCESSVILYVSPANSLAHQTTFEWNQIASVPSDTFLPREATQQNNRG